MTSRWARTNETGRIGGINTISSDCCSLRSCQPESAFDRASRSQSGAVFGSSDSREALHRFFEIDEGHIVTADLSNLVATGRLSLVDVRFE